MDIAMAITGNATGMKKNLLEIYRHLKTKQIQKQIIKSNQNTIMYRTCNTAGHASAYANYRNPAHANWRKRPKYNVPVNIEEKGSNYEVSVYATGFDKENIRLSIVEDVLYISGTRTIAEDAKPSFIKQEFPVRSFERVLFLNGKVDTTNISARQENGVLIITLAQKAGSADQGQEIKID